MTYRERHVSQGSVCRDLLWACVSAYSLRAVREPVADFWSYIVADDSSIYSSIRLSRCWHVELCAHGVRRHHQRMECAPHGRQLSDCCFRTSLLGSQVNKKTSTALPSSASSCYSLSRSPIATVMPRPVATLHRSPAVPPAVPPLVPLGGSPVGSPTSAASSARAPAPPPSTTAPDAGPSTPSGCHPLSDEGTCYEPGEYCRNSDHGASGVAGDGERIICEDNDGWRWEPA